MDDPARRAIVDDLGGAVDSGDQKRQSRGRCLYRRERKCLVHRGQDEGITGREPALRLCRVADEMKPITVAARDAFVGTGVSFSNHYEVPVFRNGKCLYRVLQALATPIPPYEDRQQRARRYAKRSEEHTSELQSPCNLVCRLL